jgi:hypothetical protein
VLRSNAVARGCDDSRHTEGTLLRTIASVPRLSRNYGASGRFWTIPGYGDPKQPEKPIAWLWKFIDGAKTAGDLYGRALVVIAAEQHACRLVVPSGQRFGAKRWPSHKDHAAKALQKLAGPHLPATLKQLEKAIAKAGAKLHAAQEQARAESRSRVVAVDKPNTRPDAGAIDDAAEPAETAGEGEEVDDELVDEQLEDEDIVDPDCAVGSGGDRDSDTPPPAK